MPPLKADERETLSGWLDFYRDTLALKCQGLTEEQLSTVALAPSELTLRGLVQHMAEVERNWFRRVLAGEDAPPIHDPEADPDATDGGFALSADGSFAQAFRTWQGEIKTARANCAARGLEDTVPFMGGEVTLRWIHSHMIAEYARHCGHADLLREHIDGQTGV
ncbi:DinB family protein [Streptomyces sp. ODS28]|uniref:DinB family protein n=1 Tax=Streptomyces sp. ODS28 TaxID=3136688 RepID=UPI0031EBBF95